MSHYVTENNDLRDKLRISEKQLNDARDNIVVLSRKLNEADQGLQVNIFSFIFPSKRISFGNDPHEFFETSLCSAQANKFF